MRNLRGSRILLTGGSGHIGSHIFLTCQVKIYGDHLIKMRTKLKSLRETENTLENPSVLPSLHGSLTRRQGDGRLRDAA